MKADKQKTELILNHVLELIYMLTGEEYIIVKKNSCHDNIHLKTEEIPVKYDDVAVYFSKEEWEYVEAHRDIYRDAMIDNQSLDSLGILSNRSSDNNTAYMDRSTSLPKHTLFAAQSRANIIKKTCFPLSSSNQFTPLMHGINKLGRRMTKIDRNIAHILKAFKTKDSVAASKWPESNYHVSDNLSVPTVCKQEILSDECPDEVYQPEHTTSSISSFESLPYSQNVTGSMCSTPPNLFNNITTFSSPPVTSPIYTNHFEQSQIHHDSLCKADSTGETAASPPPPQHTSVRALFKADKTDLPAEEPSALTNLPKLSKHHPAYSSTNSSSEAEIPTSVLSTVMENRAQNSCLPSGTTAIPNINCPAIIIVSKASDQKEINFESLRTPDTVGEPLPDIHLSTMNSALLSNFKMQSRGQPHRFAQLLFQHHVPYSLYKTWTHNTNFDGSRGKHALPNNLKRIIMNETSVAYKMTPAVLKKIKDTLNGLLRIPRTGGWESNS